MKKEETKGIEVVEETEVEEVEDMELEVLEEAQDERDLTEDVDISAVSPEDLYLREIGKYPVLSDEEEKRIAREVVAGNLESRAYFISCNLRLVVSIAKRFKSNKIEFLDIVQEGNLGLVKAVEKYDPEMKTKFSTYATWWIKQAILRSFQNKGEAIRLPVSVGCEVKKIKRFSDKFYEQNRRYPDYSEIAEGVKFSLEKVKELSLYVYETVSMNTSINDEEDSELGDFLPDNTYSPEKEFNKKQRHELMLLIVKKSRLKDMEKKVIELRYGLDGSGLKTMEEVAKELNITKERVRFHERKALQKMRGTANYRYKDVLFD